MESTVSEHLHNLFDEKRNCFLLRRILLSDILKTCIDPSELRSKVESSESLTTGIFSLNSEETLKCCPISSETPDYDTFDVELLYKLIKNLCPSLKPTKGWGKKPDAKHNQSGDEIERIRIFKDELLCYIKTAEIDRRKYEEIWNELEFASKKIQTFTKAPRSIHEYHHLWMHFEETKYMIAALLKHKSEGKS